MRAHLSLGFAVAALSLVTLAGCAAGDPFSTNGAGEESLEQAQPAVLYGHHPHLMKPRPVQTTLIPGGTGGDPDNLKYYGGHVISNVKIQVVFWGNSVNPITVAQIPGFFQAITNSAYMDWLAEYDTNRSAVDGTPGTNQHIGRGTLAGTWTITPSAPTSGTVTNDQIQTELAAQIGAGHLPKNDENTLYMIYFPSGLTITMPDGNGGTASSCQQFCAYHNTMQIAGQSVYYGVMPDISSGFLCILGCGASLDTFGSLCSASSHEMVEAVTDAEIGLATDYKAPMAWYDNGKDGSGNEHGEIGDICAGQKDTVAGFTVQKEWSNHDNACISSRASQPVPPTVSVTSPADGAGVSGSVTVTASAAAGGASTLTKLEVFVDGVSLGSSATSPASIAWDTTKAANGAHAITAVATDADGQTATAGAHNVTVKNTVPPRDLVKNGGFEGSLASWTLGGKAPVLSTVHWHTGKNSMRCGANGTVHPNGDSFGWQAVTIPAGVASAKLTFWAYSTATNTTADANEALIRDASGSTVLLAIMKGADNTKAWTQHSADLTALAGQTVQLYFNARGTPAAPATLWIDDVSLVVQ